MFKVNIMYHFMILFHIWFCFSTDNFNACDRVINNSKCKIEMTDDEIFLNKTYDEQFFKTNNKIKPKDNKEPTTKKQISEKNEKRLLCHYTNWSKYRKGNAKFLPENIDVSLCTHVIFAYAKLDNHKLAPYENDDIVKAHFSNGKKIKGLYERVTGLKTKNSSLKVMLSVGGINLGSKQFSEIASNQTILNEFISSAIVYLKTHNFDGLDLAWFYPSIGEQEHFSIMIKVECIILASKMNKSTKSLKFKKELKKAFISNGFILSATVSGDYEIGKNAYEIPKISKDLDFINVQTFDYNQNSESLAPLFSTDRETQSVDSTIKYWLKQGASKEKLNLGISLYGNVFTIHSSDGSSKKALFERESKLYTNDDDLIANFEICQLFGDSTWKLSHSDQEGADYAHKGNKWISYNDKLTLGKKINYLKKLDLGGVFVFSFDLDDFNGKFCNQVQYPFLKQIKKQLNDLE